jgi:hypothetical protein
MSQHDKGNGTGNGSGLGEKAWNLAEDGMLWKVVLDYQTEDWVKRAQGLIAQLQESVQPADALQGLLLDRIAAGYLRKQLMLEAEAAGREGMKASKEEEFSGPFRGDYSAEEKRMMIAAHPLHLWFGDAFVLRYEALLDQALHRDLILLQQLKKAAAAARAASAQPPPESNRRLIEGEVEHPDVS